MCPTSVLPPSRRGMRVLHAWEQWGRRGLGHHGDTMGTPWGHHQRPSTGPERLRQALIITHMFPWRARRALWKGQGPRLLGSRIQNVYFGEKSQKGPIGTADLIVAMSFSPAGITGNHGRIFLPTHAGEESHKLTTNLLLLPTSQPHWVPGTCCTV